MIEFDIAQEETSDEDVVDIDSLDEISGGIEDGAGEVSEESYSIRDAYDRLNSRLFNNNLEWETIGHIINVGEDQVELLTSLKPDHFNDDNCHRIFSLMQTMFAEKNDIDQISVAAFVELKVNQKLVTSTLKTLDHCSKLSLTDSKFNSMSRLREMLKNRMIYSEVLQKGGQMFSDNVPTQDILEHMTNILINVEAGRPEKATKQVAKNVVDSILNPLSTDRGLDIGLSEIDMNFGGIRKDTYYTIGAASGMGKTAFVIDLVERLCSKYPDKIRVLFFSMEMSEERIMKRLISRKTGLSVTDLEGRISDLTPEQRELVKKAGDEIGEYPLEMVYQIMTCNQIKLRARKFALQNPGKQLIIVADHIGLVTGATNDMRVNTINASSTFKSLCVEYDASMFVLTQFTKEVEGKDNRANYYRPSMRYIMESGRVRQDSDVVWLLYRPDVYFNEIPYGQPNEEGEVPMWKTQGKMIICAEKNRDGFAPCDIVLDCDIKINKLNNPSTIF